MVKKIKLLYYANYGADKKTDKIYIAVFLAVAFFAYFSFGLFHLTKFQTADERYWMYEDPENGRIHSYWEAIREGKWKNTYINDKPGVSLAYISGIALFFKSEPAENLFTKKSFERDYNPQEIERTQFLFRLPLLIFNGLFCLLLFWLIKRFTENYWIALWSAIFILLSPILLGISQIVNPDSVLWSFSAGAILAFFNYLKSKEKKFIFLSALFLGFSLLTKYSAIILIPYFLVAVAANIFFEISEGKIKKSREIGVLLGGYVAAIAGALAVFSIFLPAVFFNFSYLYQETFFVLSGIRHIFIAVAATTFLLFFDMTIFKSKAFFWIVKKTKPLENILPKMLSFVFLAIFSFVLFTWMSDVKYGEVIMRKVPFDMEKGLAFRQQSYPVQIILEFVPLLFSITPLALFALLFVLAKSTVKKIAYSKPVFLILFFLSAFYSAVLLQNLLVTIRYSIMVYPLVLFLAGIGFWEIFSWKKLQGINKIWITAGILIVSVFSLWTIKPFYFNYTNSLLPESRIITDGWGYGEYEAAEFLNQLPDAEKLVVWADYQGFCPFLKGKCIMGKSDGKFKPGISETVPDYFVKTRRGSIVYKGMWNTIKKEYLYNDSDPIWELSINGKSKNYVKIFKLDSEQNR